MWQAILTGGLTLTEQLADADEDDEDEDEDWSRLPEVIVIVAVCVPGLVNEFEQLAPAPEHAPDHE